MQYTFNPKNRWKDFRDDELHILMEDLKRGQIHRAGNELRTRMASEVIAEISRREMMRPVGSISNY